MKKCVFSFYYNNLDVDDSLRRHHSDEFCNTNKANIRTFRILSANCITVKIVYTRVNQIHRNYIVMLTHQNKLT